MAFKVNDVEITSLLGTSIKTGRDSQNLIDFATTDNKLIFRVNNVNEVELVENVLQPTTNDGVALGTTSLGWSDLHLASAGVLNWANGEMTITESDANTLTVAGGTFATAALTTTTIAASGDTTIADGYGLIVGHSAFDTTMWAAYATPEFQVLGTGVDSGIGAVRYSADAFGPMIGMGKSRDASLAGNTAVVDNDVLGKLMWFGADGNAAAGIGAELRAEINGSPSNTSMPTDLVFSTTAASTIAPTERLRIDTAGLITFPTASATTAGLIVGHSAKATIASTTTAVEIVGVGDPNETSSLMLANYQTAAGGPSIYFGNARGNAVHNDSNLAIVADGDELGNIVWAASDGTDMVTRSAAIQVLAEGTMAENRIPSEMLFRTMSAASPGVLTTAMTISPDQNVRFAANIDLATPLLAGADHSTTGLTAQMLAGGAISAFDLVCIHTVTGEVVEADASAYATARVIGIAPADISDTATGTILLQGFIRDDTWNWTTGSTLYLSETAGAMTHTAPTTDGAFVQVVGVALEPDVVYINPSMTVIEHA